MRRCGITFRRFRLRLPVTRTDLAQQFADMPVAHYRATVYLYYGIQFRACAYERSYGS